MVGRWRSEKVRGRNRKGVIMITTKDKETINAAAVGDIVELSDGRKIEAEHSTRRKDCHTCELHDEDCDGLNCDNMKTVYRNESGI